MELVSSLVPGLWGQSLTNGLTHIEQEGGHCTALARPQLRGMKNGADLSGGLGDKEKWISPNRGYTWAPVLNKSNENSLPPARPEEEVGDSASGRKRSHGRRQQPQPRR